MPLSSLAQKAPVGPFALVSRAKGDIDRLQTVLQSFGYYRGRAVITVDGVAVDDPGLVGRLSAVPAGTSVEVKVAIEMGVTIGGRRFHFRLRHHKLPMSGSIYLQK